MHFQIFLIMETFVQFMLYVEHIFVVLKYVLLYI